MAQQSLPLTTASRTLTVRVRTLVIAVAALVVVGLAWWALSWASGIQPLATGSWTTQPVGLRVAAQTPDALAPGPTAYVWHPGGRYLITLQLHNSASVAVTVTGVDHTFADWAGAVAGPTLENGNAGTLEPIAGPFHATRIAPDSYGVVTLVFRANPRAVCGGGTTESTDDVTLHFTTLGVFHNTQTVPLGDMAAIMAAPPSGC